MFYGLEVTEKEVEELIDEVDDNGDRVCDFEEFQECVKILERRYEEKLRKQRKEERQACSCKKGKQFFLNGVCNFNLQNDKMSSRMRTKF